MSDFIMVHVNGESRMINLYWVEEVCDNDGAATIYFAFTGPECVEQDYIVPDETYNEIVNMIWR